MDAEQTNDRNDETTNENKRSRLKSVKDNGANLVDGADGSIIWLIKWCASQLKLAAEAISQQLLSAQNSAQRRIEENRQNDER